MAGCSFLPETPQRRCNLPLCVKSDIRDLYKYIPMSTEEYVNPVIWGNHPDPSVLALQGGGYLAVSTSNYAFGFRNDAAFPLQYSEDLIHWTFKGYAFPGGTWPSWAYMDMWAPELHFINGVFTLYFSARMKTTRKLALGVAVAKDLGDLFSGFKDLGYPLLQVATLHLPSCKSLSAPQGID